MVENNGDNFQTNAENHNKSLASQLFRTISFTIHKQIFAMDILHIRDIILAKNIYRMPNANDLLIGVTNIRGEIVPIYSIKKILGFEDHLLTEENKDQMILSPEKDEYLIILKLDHRLLAISVDQINKNISVSEENFNLAPYINTWDKQTIFSGVIIDDSDNILLINGELLKKYITNYQKNKQY